MAGVYYLCVAHTGKFVAGANFLFIRLNPALNIAGWLDLG